MNKFMMPAICVAALAAARPVGVIGAPRFDLDGDTEKMLKTVSQQLESLNGDIKATAEDALKQAKKSGEVSAETKETADKLLTQQTATNKVVEALKASLEGIDSKILDVSQQVANGMGHRPEGVMSLGQAAVAQEEQIKAFLSNGASGQIKIDVSNAITSAAGSGGGLTYHEEERAPVNMPRRRLLIRSLLTQGRTSSDLVKYRKQTLRTDATASIAEAGTYPESAFGWTKADAKVIKIGAHTNITEETMADADLLQTEIDTELRHGLDLNEEKQVLAGDGTGENLSGLITEATAFVAAAGLPNATHIDRLRLAILQIVLADYIPTGMVLNPTDWAAIELLKDAQLRYVFGNPGTQSTPMLWGKDIADSNTMSAGEWLVGDFPMAATIYDRADAEVLISSEHDTNFIEDMLTMKARKRLAMAVKRPAAMVKGNFTFA
jgi:HK97 family phage major capsid protein